MECFKMHATLTQRGNLKRQHERVQPWDSRGGGRPGQSVRTVREWECSAWSYRMVAPHHHTLVQAHRANTVQLWTDTGQQLRVCAAQWLSQVPLWRRCCWCRARGVWCAGQVGRAHREGPLRWKLPCITSAVNLKPLWKQDLLTLKMYPFNTGLLFLFFHSLLLFLSKEYSSKLSEHEVTYLITI